MTKRILQVMLVLVLMGAALFGTAGGFDWPMAWWYVAVYVGVLTVNASLLRRSPDLLKERSSVKPDAKGWDRWLAPLVSVYGQTAVLVVAGLERRFGWSVGFAVWLQWAGLAVVIGGYGLISWAMHANRFFSAVVTVRLLAVRTALEDATLQRELKGYGEFVGRVRYRLVPWVW